MKTYIILPKILLFILSLTACVEVQFRNPQPLNARDLPEIPAELHGTYQGKTGDTLVVSAKGFYPDKAMLLKPDKLLLRQKGEYYFLNQKNDQFWSLILFKVNNTRSITTFMIDAENEQAINKLKNLTKVEEERGEDGEIKRYIINPSEAELEKMLEQKIFQKFDKLKKIKVQ